MTLDVSDIIEQTIVGDIHQLITRPSPVTPLLSKAPKESFSVVLPLSRDLAM